MLKSRNATGLRNNNKSGHLQCTSLAVAVRPTCCRSKYPSGSIQRRRSADLTTVPRPPPCDDIIVRRARQRRSGIPTADPTSWSHCTRIPYTRVATLAAAAAAEEKLLKYSGIIRLIAVNRQEKKYIMSLRFGDFFFQMIRLKERIREYYPVKDEFWRNDFSPYNGVSPSSCYSGTTPVHKMLAHLMLSKHPLSHNETFYILNIKV